MDVFDLSLSTLDGIGKKREELFKKLGVDNVGTLLEFYPRLYEDWNNCYEVSNAPIDEKCCIKAVVCTPVRENRIRKGMTIYTFSVTDLKKKLRVVIFNNKYSANKVHLDDEILLYGKLTRNNRGQIEMNSPQIEPALSAKIRPIYRQTDGLQSKVIEKTVMSALKKLDDSLVDAINDKLRQEYHLCHKRFALQRIHFPESQQDIAIATHRLVFEEMLVFSLAIIQMKRGAKSNNATPIKCDYTKEFISKLPFKMTGAQEKAVVDATNDMSKSTPMNRLLQGDVGSGKTAVAAALLYNCAKNGYQSALMAPTEILAYQHYVSLSHLMQNTGVKIMFLSGSTPKKQKEAIYEMLKIGDIDILVGTHAIIQKNVEFKNLSLVITDEQHRFGVAQRGILSSKGQSPHVYVMSATPIPRTLALIIYGDLDISVLDELPANRKPIETYCVTSAYHKRVYAYVKKHLDEGRQGYIVCPMIDDNDETELASAVKFYEQLSSGEFSSYKVGLLTGKMKPDEKNIVMNQFKNGTIQLLISTTVIEVGVDVPNAVIMLIENAERFGLSQLHQLRGRVGRGDKQSTCILISDADNEIAKKRLKVMCDTTDGFKIADEDLKLRGPGDFFGSRQHGLPEFKIANLMTDMKVLKLSQKLARQILKDDPNLQSPENRELAKEVKRMFENTITT